MAFIRPMLSALLWLVGAATVNAMTVINVTNESLATKIAVQTCAGLMNRDETVAGAAYVLGFNGNLEKWLADIEGITDPTVTPASQMLQTCMSTVAKGHIRYNSTSQKRILPNIITLAGVLDAVPLEDGHELSSKSPMVFDAVVNMAGFSALEATRYVYENHVNQTTTMAKMNPGLATNDKKHVFNPPLTGSLDPGLVDYSVKERLFSFFLNDGCIPLTEEHALMKKMVENNPWPRPIAVYGYDNTFSVEGSVFEAETTCVPEHNMGQIASAGVSNLAFFSRKPPIDTPLLQNPEPATEQFNKSKTYIAFVVGDGDNMKYLQGARRSWMEERVQKCQAGQGCFPLLWTINPHTLHLAPDMARWYFNQSYITQHDYFVLPPSGDLYAYPGMMPKKDQAAFVANTERDCKLLNSSGTSTWEWFTGWHKAIEEFYPLYAKNGIVRTAYAVNVPFNLPTLVFGPEEFYKVFNEKFVLFRPFEWRGTRDSSGNIPFSKHTCLSVTEMAKQVNGYPRGTVTAIYMTSDGGGNLQDFYDLEERFDEHVQVVSHTVLADMALAAKRAGSHEEARSIVVI